MIHSPRTIVLPLFLAVFLVGCNRPAGQPASEPAKQPGPPAVTTVHPTVRPMTHRIDQPGEIRAYEETPIFARISGYVGKVNKDYGDPVVADEVLAELSVPEMREELKQKEALALQADAEVVQARKLVDAAEADVAGAKAKQAEAEAGRARVNAELRRAESQFTRLKKSESVLTQEQIEELQLGVEAARAAVAEVEAKIGSAKADVSSKEAKRDKAKADVAVAEAHLKVAQANQRYTAEMLKYAELRAPYAGIITRRNIDRGKLLQATPGQADLAFIVARTDVMRVMFDVPEDDAILIQDGMPAIIAVPALKGEEFTGPVKRSSWSLDAKGGRTLHTEVELKNSDGRLRPGMYVLAAIAVKRPSALAVPATAVLAQGEQTFCFLVKENKAVRTPVRTGFRDGQFVEVIAQKGPDGSWRAFAGDEPVIAAPPANLADGQAVQVMN
jgi:RND family efflux transporter MFP subunit